MKVNIAEIEAGLACPLPRQYREFLAGEPFDDLKVGQVELWGTEPNEWGDSLLDRITADKLLFVPLHDSGFLQIGRPEDGSYDPICIAPDGRIVRVDHERCLQFGKVKVVEVIAESFKKLMHTSRM